MWGFIIGVVIGVVIGAIYHIRVKSGLMKTIELAEDISPNVTEKVRDIFAGKRGAQPPSDGA